MLVCVGVVGFFWFLNVFWPSRPPYVPHVRHYNEVIAQITNGIVYAATMNSSIGGKSPRIRTLCFNGPNLSLYFIIFLKGATKTCTDSPSDLQELEIIRSSHV